MNSDTQGLLAGANPTGQQILKLRRRLKNLNSLISGLREKACQSKDATVLGLLEHACANALSATSMVDAAEVVQGQSALEILRVGGVEVEVAQATFADVTEIDSLKAYIGKQAVAQPRTKQNGDDFTIMLDLEPNAFDRMCNGAGCSAPDPDRYFGGGNSTGDKPRTARYPFAGNEQTVAGQGFAGLTVETVCVVVPVDLSSKTTRVDELVRMSESTIGHAELQLRQARQASCNGDSDSCSI